MPHRPEFLAALNLLVEAIEDLHGQGFARPVLVGGAAVELWTGSSIVSGDFDLVTNNRIALEEALIARGFVRPSGTGALLRGVHHPELGLGVEVVSGQVFDGAVPPERLVLLEMPAGGLVVVSVEDLIADRIGQYASHEPSNWAMLDQAVQLFRLAGELDHDYLDARIRTESSSSYDLGFLMAKVAEHESRSLPGSGPAP